MQAIPALSTGLQSATAAFDAVSQYHAAKSSALVDEDNARLAELQGAFEGEDLRRRGRAVQGEAIAAMAEGGNAVGEGSAADLIYQNSLEIERSVLASRYSAATEARGLRFKAAQERMAGRSALIGGFLRAGAAALTGATNASNQAREDAAYQRYNDAYFPGGQRLPMPPPPPTQVRY